MDKLVYLFELDSVRSTPQEMEKGQQAMFEEIVRNGNRVVLSLNQLTDSQAFLAAVKNKDSYPHILELFKKGALKVSHYGNVRTPSQYIQNAIEKCNTADDNTFIFSALPVLRTQRELLDQIHRALRFSDPAILTERLQALKSQEAAISPEARAEFDLELERLDFIERYIRMILLLSTEALSKNRPKQEKSCSFSQWMDLLLPYCQNSSQPLVAQAALLLEKARDEILQQEGGARFVQNRSVWFKQLNEAPSSQATFMAQAIVDLCYNYTIEDSILDVSLHYDPGAQETFFQDFQRRLQAYWQDYQEGIHQFYEGDAVPQDQLNIPLPNWATAVRLYEAHGNSAASNQRSYEKNYDQEKHSWRMCIAKAFVRAVCFSLVYIVLLVVIDLAMGNVEDFLFPADGLGASQALLVAIMTSLLFGIAGSVITMVTKLPDFLDIFKSMFRWVQDVLITWRSPKNQSYKNPQQVERNE